MSAPAAIAVARAITDDRPVFVVGAAAPAGWQQVAVAEAEQALRDQATNGAAVVVAGDLGSPRVRDRILRRAPAWGLTAVWVGADAAPDAGMALRIATTDPDAAVRDLARDAEALVGDVTALAPMVVDCTDEVCVTCSDEGRLGEVIAPPEQLFAPAIVRTATGVEEVDTTLVGTVAAGDLIVIHAGGAIAVVSEPADRFGEEMT